MERRKQERPAEQIVFMILIGCVIAYMAMHTASYLMDSVAGSSSPATDAMCLGIAFVLSVLGLEVRRLLIWKKAFFRQCGIALLVLSLLIALLHTFGEAIGLLICLFQGMLPALAMHSQNTLISAVLAVSCGLGLYKVLPQRKNLMPESTNQFLLSYLPCSSFDGLFEKVFGQALKMIVALPNEHPILMRMGGAAIGAGCIAFIVGSFWSTYQWFSGSIPFLQAYSHVSIPAVPQMSGSQLSFPAVVLGITLLTYAVTALLSLGEFFRTSLCVPEFLGNGVILSPEGIGGVGVLNTRLRGHWRWSDLHHILVQQKLHPPVGEQSIGKVPEKGCLIFDFKTGDRASIDLDRLAPDDLEKLFLAIESWANPLCCSAAAVALKKQVLTKSDDDNPDSLTYTQLWEQSLADNFAATNFVPLKAGSSLQSGKLTIVLPISCRGLSSVYLAESGEHKRVVLKECVLPPLTDELKQKKAEELFRREASILARLKHPNIVKVFDHFVEHGREYMVLEYLPGVNLRQFVAAHGPCTEEQVLRWAEVVCEILEYLHGQETPVIHRDLTPDNLIMTKSGKLVLVDFGAARDTISNATGTLVGKQSYMAPEQFRGKATEQSDIYALGCTMYFLLTGSDPEALMEAHAQDIRPDVSRLVNDLISLCTRLEQSERPLSAADLKSRIRSIIKNTTDSSPPHDDGQTINISKKELV